MKYIAIIAALLLCIAIVTASTEFDAEIADELADALFESVMADSESMTGRSINNRGLDLIKNFEGWRSCWYKDAAGYPTIGYGHLIKGSEYRKGQCISKATGTQLLKQDSRTAENCVSGAVRTKLNDNQFAALVSFTYNLGCGNLRSSTLLKRVNARNFGDVCNQLSRWVRAGGRVLEGLKRRRKAECALFHA
mmetsp:Transcript_11701/g.17368  ORF Transcript_11701/g.17368 Transcript_11701/m.17368 type:complete len:193 (-) Transcript_11701:93-671(-)